MEGHGDSQQRTRGGGGGEKQGKAIKLMRGCCKCFFVYFLTSHLFLLSGFNYSYCCVHNGKIRYSEQIIWQF